ncbi:MAG: beta strand repeat-containing protein, partial [Isosphaeraceae bacterium]
MNLFRKSNQRSNKSRTVARCRPANGRRLPLVLEALEARTLLSAVSWTSAAGGNWNTAANWSGDVVPNATQDATINIAVSGPITIDSASALHSLTDTTANLDITSGSLSLAAASSVSQNVTISGGVLASAGSLTIGGALSESGGVVTGGGTVTVNGLLTWTGGTMSGAGTTLAAGGLQLGANGNSYTEFLEARTLENAGSATWASEDALSQSAGSIFQNLANATLTVQSGVTWNADNGTLDNQFQGTVTVDAGTGTASFNGFFTNEGDLEVSSGTLVLGGSGSVTGNTKVDAGATLQFGGTQYVFNLGAGLTGQGTVTFGYPATDPAAIFEAGSSYSFSGATIIDNATVVFDATASTETLNQSSGDLGGSGTLTVAKMTTWTGGTMSGPGITQALGGLSLGASGDTSDHEALAGRMLINAGAGVWYGPDTLNQEEDSTFLNYSGATLQIVGGGTLDDDSSVNDSSGTFENNGAIIVADGSATTLVQTYFINSGTVEVASGTLQLGAGGACPWNALAVKAGFTVDSGAGLLFGNDYNYEAYAFNSGGYISGAGSVTFGSGVSANFGTGSTYNVSGATLIDTAGAGGDNVVFTAGSTVGPLGNLTIEPGLVNFSTGTTITVANLSLTNGSATLTGSDTLDVSGLSTWTDGTMNGSGATVAEGGLDLGLADGGSHSPLLESRTLINQGTANWVGLGAINLDDGSTFANELGATFYDQANGSIGSDSSGLFDNLGTFVVEGGGTATMASRFDNEGQLAISSGTWELSGDGGSSGDFTVDAGASLQLNNNYGIPYTVNQNGDFVSSPQIIGGGPTNVTLIGGSDTLPTPLGDTTEIDGGTYEETGTEALSSLDMTGGYLIVTGTLTVTGPITWTGGYIAGPGTLDVNGNLTLGTGTGGDEDLYGTTLENQSVIYALDGDAFYQGDGAVVENNILHYIDFEGDGTWDGDATGTIDNQGTIEKTAGTGTTTVNNVALINDGAVTVSSGTLDLEGGGTATGAFTTAAQTTLDFGHFSWAFNSTSSVSGAGTVEFAFDYFSSYFNSNSVYNLTGTTQVDSGEQVDFLSGSNVENLGAVTLTSGTLDLSSSVAPAVSADSASSLTESGGVLTGSDQLTVSGQTTWTGGTMSGTGTTITEGSVQPGLLLGASGDTNDVEYLTVRTLEVTGGGILEPLDALEQSYGSTFVNTASDTLDVFAGVNWHSDGTASIDNQGALVVGAGISTATISAGGNFPFLTNPGGIEVLSGTLDLACDGTATGTLPASFTVAAGCTLQFSGDFNLGAGAGVGGPGIVEVPSRSDLWFTSGAFSNFVGTMTIDGGTVEYDDSAEAGTLNLSSGDLTGPGTLTVSTLTVWTGGTMDGVGNTIAQGTLDVGLPTDTDDVETLDGRTLTNAGTAAWAGGGSFVQLDGATFVNQANASLDIDNGSTWYSNDGTGTIANAGTLLESASGDTTTIHAALDNTGSVKVEQGTLSLQGGGTVGGTYLVLASATLTFGNDNVTIGSESAATTSVALPSDFTTGPFNWLATFAGTAQDNGGSGLASVGVSLFNGADYYNGTAFASPTQVYNAAVLSGNSWPYTIPTSNFTSDLAYTAETAATAKNGDTEPSTIASFLLAPAIIAPAVAITAPANGTDTNNNKPTLT